jgi:hypothetical protein
VWDYTICEQHSPDLEAEILTKEIPTTSFQFLLWGLKKIRISHSNPTSHDESGSDIHLENEHLAGECYVSIHKIFDV